jgi:hypothetical protein
MFFYSNEVQVGKFQVEKLANVWRLHFEISPIELLHVTKQNLYKKTLKHMKNFLAQTWNLIWNLQHLQRTLFDTLETWSFQELEKPFLHTPQTSTLKLSTTRRTFFHTFSQPLTLKLSTTWRTLFHIIWNPKTLWRTLSHTLNLKLET